MGLLRTLSGIVCWGALKLATTWSQQTPQYSLFLLNPVAWNAAYAGSENTLLATGVYRRQWNGLQGAPESYQANVHFPITRFNAGTGLIVETETIGAHRIAHFGGMLSYSVDLSRNATLTGGLRLGYRQFSLDGAVLRAPEGQYDDGTGLFNHNDDFLPQGLVKAGGIYLDGGVLLRIRKLEFGLGLTPAYSGPVRLEDAEVKTKSHLFTGVNLRWAVSGNLSARTGVLVKSDLVFSQAEISNFFTWKNNILLGTSFRGFSPSTVDAVVLYGGMKLNPKTQLVYSFDLPLSPLKTTHRGSHEITVQYDLGKTPGKGKLPPVIYNPRFL